MYIIWLILLMQILVLKIIKIAACQHGGSPSQLSLVGADLLT